MEKKIFNITATKDFFGDRIDKFLQSQLTKVSRTKLQNLIHDGYIKLNNTIIYEASKKIELILREESALKMMLTKKMSILKIL